ncbi:hypothetical protein [Sphingomonas nostoxanthinifaciens]|uniref:hypothetical protein n=1 Tax=Sphingomonas nostoxanthinifaciens TaxID=2872652 RepID=UPI001CC1F425|nr:hypothetical protein [Sphingomonas nostoxanthinifaciens]UAK25189.1 hypothetical protein K8P63_03010 [Sphingomonas nostoxanthinifaciens]
MSRRFVITLALLATAAGAAPPKAPPAATPIGAAVNCVPITSIRETRVRDDRTIDFVMNGRTVYRNTLPNSCPELGFEQAFAYETSLSQLCSVDLITVLHHGGPPMRGASCGLGTFQPVTLADPRR